MTQTDTQSPSIPTAFQGEVMLAGWSQTHNGGAKVSFWLQDDADLEAFKAMTVAKGKTAGQRMMMVCVLIGEDEQPTQPPAADQPAKPKGGELARLAGQFSTNTEFQEWCNQPTADAAAEWIRTTCCVGSRAELDHDEEAARRFHRLVRIPFKERAV